MNPQYIVLHHSLTADGQVVNWQAIRRYHVVERGWREIGYHYGIEKIGDRYEVLVGRLMNRSGAHCREDYMNSRSLGICLVGDFDRAPPPAEQWIAALDLVRSLMDTLLIQTANVIGHREVAAYKSCPGRLFDLDAFRVQV